VAYAFPKVKIVTTACDEHLDHETCFIRPGLGNFGDRYFGTDTGALYSDTEDLPNASFSSQSGTPSSPQPQTYHHRMDYGRDLSPVAPLRSFESEDVFNTI
jgi:hypothetical protein